MAGQEFLVPSFRFESQSELGVIMKLDKGCALFFATKIDSKSGGVAPAKPGDGKYFDAWLQRVSGA